MQSEADAKYWVGVEIGGTKIRAGVCGPGLKLRRKLKLSTKADRGARPVIERVMRAINDVVDEADLPLKEISGVGVGAPGMVAANSGEVIFSPNLNWQEVPLRKELEKGLDLPVAVASDGCVASLGAYLVEHKSRPTNLLGLFVGTRISGGLILNGEPFHGFNHSAGEIGHLVMEVGGPKCDCGSRGCLEALASRTAIFQQIRAAAKDGGKTVLAEILDNDWRNLRCSDLRKALRQGDSLVEEIVRNAARHLGIALGGLINVVNPEVVVLGGGVLDALADRMLPTIRTTAADYVMPGAYDGIRIEVTSLGDTASIIGAAALASQQLR